MLYKTRLQALRWHHGLAWGLILVFVGLAFQLVRGYGLNTPISDDALQMLDIAFRVQDNTLQTKHLLGAMQGHLTWTAYAMIALIARWGWQPITTVYISFGVSILRFLALAVIVYHTVPRWRHLILIPLAVINFALPFHIIWLSTIMITWNFSVMFALWSVAVLVILPRSWWALALSGMLAFASTVSLAGGLAIAPALLFTLWLYGYRWRGWAAWFGITLFIAAVFIRFSGALDIAGGSMSMATLLTLPQWGVFFVGYLGALFHNLSNYSFVWYLNLNPTYDQQMAILAGTGLLVVTVINTIQLWRSPTNRRQLAPWLTLLVFTFGVTGIFHIGRRGATSQFLPLPLQDYYVLYSTAGIAGCAVLIFLNSLRLRSTDSPQRLVHLNIWVGVILSVLFSRGTLYYTQNATLLYNRDFQSPLGAHPVEICAREYVYTQREDCFGGAAIPSLIELPDDVYRMAYYGMSVYHDAQPEHILRDAVSPDDKYVLETNTPWMNAYMRKWWLAGVTESQLFHIAPLEDYEAEQPITMITMADFSHPISDWYHSYPEADEALAAFLEETETVWFITNQREEYGGADALAGVGYQQVSYTLNLAPYRDNLIVMKFKRTPAPPRTYTEFNSIFRLRGYTLTSAPPLTPCEIVTLTSWWDVVGEPDDNYALRWALVDASGNDVSFSMSGLTDTPTLLWQSGNLYYDERQMALPCDLTQGDYRFVVTIETADRTVQLPVTAGSLEGDPPVLQAIRMGS